MLAYCQDYRQLLRSIMAHGAIQLLDDVIFELLRPEAHKLLVVS